MHELVPEDFSSDPLVGFGGNRDRNLQDMIRRQLCKYVCNGLTLSWPTERIIGRVVIEGVAFPFGRDMVMEERGRG